jgi:hypothetical protein
MKRIFSSFAAIALVGAMAATAMAQGSTGIPQPFPSVNPGGPGVFPGAPGMPPNGGPIAKFDNGYLDHHPEVAQQLAHDPSLVNNQQFINSHPGLGNYLEHHPRVSTDLQEHPDRFMHAESMYGRTENTGNKAGPITRFDNGYLDHHPEVAQQLAHDPSLVNNQQFINSHQGLGNYLEHHPRVSTDLQQHPDRFMNAESHLERQGYHPFRNWRRGHGW